MVTEDAEKKREFHRVKTKLYMRSFARGFYLFSRTINKISVKNSQKLRNNCAHVFNSGLYHLLFFEFSSRRAYTGKNLYSAVLQNKFRREPRTVAYKGDNRNIHFLDI
ncbi:hypothetical protein [uncultured Ilyobacter sp.]|uniref:hypothetical protein n=1 Tax=uncultured Ilyobacter sp. TaxID=544433 RepID=UPI0029F47597|nr:hypothetical protein [uncultured Ilyobacter sp.]